MKTSEWFKACIPAPTPDTLRVQMGCHFEEVQEALEAFRVHEPHSGKTFWPSTLDVSKLSRSLKTGKIEIGIIDKIALMDAMADQIVTAMGVLHMISTDPDGVLAEVERSNASKLVDGKPVFNEHGKIKKGPNYTPPDLARFLRGES